MFRRLRLIAVVCMALVVVGCGDDPLPKPDPNPPVVTPTPTPTPPPPVTPAPTVPGPFALTSECQVLSTTRKKAKLTWTLSSGATRYRVKLSEWHPDTWVVRENNLSATTTTYETEVNAAITYYFQIEAVNTLGTTLSEAKQVCSESAPPKGPGSDPNLPPASPQPTIPGGPGAPAIGFISVPPIGSNNDLVGYMQHVLTSTVNVAVYIRVSGGWWTKPYFGSPLTPVANNGIWITDITTGGFDSSATDVAAFLVTAGYTPPPASGSGSLPISVNGTTVLAVAQQSR